MLTAIGDTLCTFRLDASHPEWWEHCVHCSRRAAYWLRVGALVRSQECKRQPYTDDNTRKKYGNRWRASHTHRHRHKRCFRHQRSDGRNERRKREKIWKISTNQSVTQKRSSVCYWFIRRMTVNSVEHIVLEISCSNPTLLSDQRISHHIFTCRWLLLHAEQEQPLQVHGISRRWNEKSIIFFSAFRLCLSAAVSSALNTPLRIQKLYKMFDKSFSERVDVNFFFVAHTIDDVTPDHQTRDICCSQFKMLRDSFKFSYFFLLAETMSINVIRVIRLSHSIPNEVNMLVWCLSIQMNRYAVRNALMRRLGKTWRHDKCENGKESKEWKRFSCGSL